MCVRVCACVCACVQFWVHHPLTIDRREIIGRPGDVLQVSAQVVVMVVAKVTVEEGRTPPVQQAVSVCVSVAVWVVAIRRADLHARVGYACRQGEIACRWTDNKGLCVAESIVAKSKFSKLRYSFSIGVNELCKGKMFSQYAECTHSVQELVCGGHNDVQISLRK